MVRLSIGKSNVLRHDLKALTHISASYKSSFKLEPAKLQSPLVSSKTKGWQNENIHFFVCFLFGYFAVYILFNVYLFFSFVGSGDDESSEAEAAVPVSAVSEEAAKQRLFGGVPQSEAQGSEADEAAAKVDSADSKESSQLKSPSQPDGDW